MMDYNEGDRMTNEQAIPLKLQGIKHAKLCDDCLSEELNISHRQQVNQIGLATLFCTKNLRSIFSNFCWS